MVKKYLAPLAAEDEVRPFEVPANEITTGTAVNAVSVPLGTYEVVLTGRCPKRIVETGLPAGEAAEAVARERYMHHYELVQRPGLIPDVKLME